MYLYCRGIIVEMVRFCSIITFMEGFSSGSGINTVVMVACMMVCIDGDGRMVVIVFYGWQLSL